MWDREDLEIISSKKIEKYLEKDRVFTKLVAFFMLIGGANAPRDRIECLGCDNAWLLCSADVYSSGGYV